MSTTKSQQPLAILHTLSPQQPEKILWADLTQNKPNALKPSYPRKAGEKKNECKQGLKIDDTQNIEMQAKNLKTFPPNLKW